MTPVVPVEPAVQRAIRTGLTEAFATDAEDDSYGISWFDDIPADHVPAIKTLRLLLRDDPDPIDRAPWWARRGLALYGSDAARPEAVADLRRRVEACSRKLAGRVSP